MHDCHVSLSYFSLQVSRLQVLAFASVSRRVEAFQMEISFIYTQILVHLHVNKTNFHMKGFALGLALKQRRKATRKSPIGGITDDYSTVKEVVSPIIPNASQSSSRHFIFHRKYVCFE